MDKHLPPETAQHLFNMAGSSIYLMGASFVLGSMFTLLLLLVLDYIKRDQIK
jgi:hypothetical protein